MADYKEMYLKLVRETEKAVTLTGQALHTLITAQRDCEEMYINSPDPIIQLVDKAPPPQRSRKRGPDMTYTEAEKRRIDNILKAFSEFIREQSYFDIVYSEKVGYVQLLTRLCETEPVTVLKTAEEVIDTLFYEVTNEAVFDPNNQRIDCDALKLSEYEEAESRRRLTAIVGAMEEDRDYWLAYIDQYLKGYQEKFIDE